MQLLKFLLFFLQAHSLPIATVEDEELRRATRDIISRNRMLNRVKIHQASRRRNAQRSGENEYLQQIKEMLKNRSTRNLKGLRIPGIIRLGQITHTTALLSVNKFIFLLEIGFIFLAFVTLKKTRHCPLIESLSFPKIKIKFQKMSNPSLENGYFRQL